MDGCINEHANEFKYRLIDWMFNQRNKQPKK